MRIILILLVAIAMTSCKTTEQINQKYPIIPLPNRPTISAELNEDDFKTLIRYATKLEIGIKEYNIHANEENKKIEEHFKNR